MPSLYSNAGVYDILHTPGTAGEVDGLLRTAARFCDCRRLSILEPACGSGRYLRVLGGRGHRVLGFDIDADMVRYARDRIERGGLTRRARVVQLDMEHFADALPGGWQSFDLAFNLINTIRHLESDEALLSHLREVRKVLRPGGVYLVGLSLSAPPFEQPSEDVWEGRRGRCHVRQLVRYIPPANPRVRKEEVISHLSITTPGGTGYADSSYWLRTYTLRQWRSIVRTAGLQIGGIFDEGGSPTRAIEPAYRVFALQARRDR